jgi:hypothetical protein
MARAAPQRKREATRRERGGNSTGFRYHLSLFGHVREL